MINVKIFLVFCIITWLFTVFCSCTLRAGWVECWTVPSVMLTIDYMWHPIYPQKADEQLKQSCKLDFFFLYI